MIMNMVGDVDFLGEHRTEGRLPTYMAPELIKGESSFSYASDVWALGILFYRLLTHEFPFKQDEAEEWCQAILEQEFEDPNSGEYGEDILLLL